MHDAAKQIPREAAIAAVDAAIRSRQSVRAFLPNPVGRTTVEQLLRLASRSASGSNIQPWRVRVIAGEAWPILLIPGAYVVIFVGLAITGCRLMQFD